jgi:hypothetical protein
VDCSLPERGAQHEGFPRCIFLMNRALEKAGAADGMAIALEKK